MYLAFGLRIASPLPLPELVPSPGPADADVAISIGSAAPPVDPVDVYGHLAAPGAVVLRFPEVGSFLVSAGEIVAEPEPGLDDAILRNFLLGPALGTLLHLRGELVLHASCVAWKGKAAAFLGDTEFGKSTIAATFLEADWELVADDVTLVRVQGGSAVVVPGYPRMKVWPESLRALGRDPDAFERVHPEIDKRDVRAERFASEPVELGALYVLAEGDEPAVRPLDPQEAFASLVANSYAADLLEATGTRERHFNQVTELCRRVPVRALATGRPLARVRDVPGIVADDLQTLSGT